MNGKRIVQIVKTLDGALWAVQQVEQLIKLGWEIHVIAPSLNGRYLSDWNKTGAILHELDCSFPTKNPFRLPFIKTRIINLITEINPSLIHTHFVTNTLLLRYALKDLPYPRIFQVPGPLHLEHSIFGQWETMWSNKNDHWIASSKYIESLYVKKYGIDVNRIHVSYYGTDLSRFNNDTELKFREKYQIPSDATLIGNVSFLYPPKFYLGQKVGLKGHELMIDALNEIMKKDKTIWAVFIGKQWGESQTYFEKVKARAQSLNERIIFTGYIPQVEIAQIWKEFDLALHIPSSENCGGVIEPLLNSVPTVASATGGLPEVIIPNETGFLTTTRSKDGIFKAITEALRDRAYSKKLAENGRNRVNRMFDVSLTAKQLSHIYNQILERNDNE